MAHLAIAVGEPAQGVSGIFDYVHIMAAEIVRQASWRVTVLVRTVDGTWSSVDDDTAYTSLASALKAAGDVDSLILQYDPFLYGRWGFAPWIIRDFFTARRNVRRAYVMIHETYVPIIGFKSFLMGLWQRFQLKLLVIQSRGCIVSTERWAYPFLTNIPRRPFTVIPPSSNLMDMRDQRATGRSLIGAGPRTVVVGTFQSHVRHQSLVHVSRTVNALAGEGAQVLLLQLGSGNPVVDGIDASVTVVRPGYLDTDDLSVRMAAVDVFISPLFDGVSSRRGTFIAALQHGVPVVATSGPSTDSFILEATDSVSLVHDQDPDHFAAAVCRLVSDRGRLEQIGAGGRRLFDREFDWPVLAKRLIAVVEGNANDDR